jgi:hypothetical protein
MTVEQLAREVEAMRACQAAYFKLKTGDALTASKAAERKIDKLVRDILNPPPAPRPGLFDEVPQ